MGRIGVVAAVVVAAAAGAFGATLLVDDDDSTPDQSALTTTTTSTEPITFADDEVPFTFEYPANFAGVDTGDLPAGFVAILGIDPVNFLDVRLTATEELSDEAILADIGGSLAGPGIEVVSQDTAEANGVTLIVFSVRDSSGAEPTESRLHFFRAGGQTWELACQLNEEGRAVVEAACDAMVDTLDLVS